MKTNETHISDEDLVRAADGEVSGRSLSRIQAHLAGCWKCRARHAEMERTIASFITAHQRDKDDHIAQIEGPRALLQARLSALQAVDPPTAWQRLRHSFFRVRGPVYASLALGTLAILGFAMYSGVQQVRASSVPDSALTPGATRTAEREDVCSALPAKGFYPIPATLAYRVFEKYKIRNPRAGSYEVDYLITPALGGADDIHNLWPQPYAAGEWNAHVKDALEDYLHRRVCAGELDLKTAQRDIAGNWIAAYRKYFKTDHPLTAHAGFTVDAPWED